MLQDTSDVEVIKVDDRTSFSFALMGVRFASAPIYRFYVRRKIRLEFASWLVNRKVSIAQAHMRYLPSKTPRAHPLRLRRHLHLQPPLHAPRRVRGYSLFSIVESNANEWTTAVAKPYLLDRIRDKRLVYQAAIKVTKPLPVTTLAFPGQTLVSRTRTITSLLLLLLQLTSLNLRAAHIGLEEVQLVASALTLVPQLEVMDLGANCIKDHDCCLLVDSIHHLSKLKKLGLGGNGFGSVGGLAIARALQHSPDLTELDARVGMSHADLVQLHL